MAMFLVVCCAIPTPAAKDFGKCFSAITEVWLSITDESDPLVMAHSRLLDYGWEITGQPIVQLLTAEHLAEMRIDVEEAYNQAQRVGACVVFHAGSAIEQDPQAEPVLSQVERVIPQSKN